MRKLFMLMLSVLLILLVGCSKVTDVVNHDIKAVVRDVDYRKSTTRTTFIPSGKIVVPMTTRIPEKYKVTLDYNGVYYTLDTKKAYYKSKDNIYKQIDCVLEVTYYSNGKTSTKIIDVK